MRYEIRPLGPWTAPITTDRARSARFRAWTAGDPPGWQANARAIALGLNALRAVDRYGITRTGEQYRGWAQIEAAPGPITTIEAALVLARAAGDGHTAERILADPQALASAYRAAARNTHPDHGGDRTRFEQVTAARDTITQATTP